jgi:hypothetical protein
MEASFLSAGFIAEDRLGWRVERVKEKVKIFLEMGKTWGFAQENGGFDSVKIEAETGRKPRQAVYFAPQSESES